MSVEFGELLILYICEIELSSSHVNGINKTITFRQLWNGEMSF